MSKYDFFSSVRNIFSNQNHTNQYEPYAILIWEVESYKTWVEYFKTNNINMPVVAKTYILSGRIYLESVSSSTFTDKYFLSVHLYKVTLI